MTPSHNFTTLYFNRRMDSEGQRSSLVANIVIPENLLKESYSSRNARESLDVFVPEKDCVTNKASNQQNILDSRNHIRPEALADKSRSGGVIESPLPARLQDLRSTSSPPTGKAVPADTGQVNFPLQRPHVDDRSLT
jgi:hypothetical protein